MFSSQRATVPKATKYIQRVHQSQHNMRTSLWVILHRFSGRHQILNINPVNTYYFCSTAWFIPLFPKTHKHIRELRCCTKRHVPSLPQTQTCLHFDLIPQKSAAPNLEESTDKNSPNVCTLSITPDWICSCCRTFLSPDLWQ